MSGSQRRGLVRALPLLLASGSLAGGVLVSIDARAREPARARLIYTADDPRGTCASEADFRGKVAARLGYDPFRDDSPVVFRVRVDARSSRPRAEIASERDGAPAGKRSLQDATCDALSETVASTIAIALDPLAGGPPREGPSSEPHAAPPTEPAPTPATSPSTTSPSPSSAPAHEESSTSTKERPRPPLVPFVLLDGTIAFGRTAGTALGGRAGFGLVYGALSVAIEMRGEASPGPVRVTPLDRVSWSVFSGGVAVCGRKSVLEACVTGAVGSLQAKAEDVARPSLESTLFGLVGPRLGAVVPITDDIGVRANAELGIPLVRTTFIIDGNPAWTAPAVQGSFGLGLEVHFR